MVGVIVPQKKRNQETAIWETAGQAVGTYYGGPAGGAAGRTAGNMVAGEDQDAQSISVPQPKNDSALIRRQQQLETDNLQTLRQAEDAAVTLPEPLRQEYLPPLTRARLLEERQRGGY